MREEGVDGSDMNDTIDGIIRDMGKEIKQEHDRADRFEKVADTLYKLLRQKWHLPQHEMYCVAVDKDEYVMAMQGYENAKKEAKDGI